MLALYLRPQLRTIEIRAIHRLYYVAIAIAIARGPPVIELDAIAT
jgi:hypothetical protein